MAVGAEVSAAGVYFRVWAPDRRTVEVVLSGVRPGIEVALEPEPGGYFGGLFESTTAGTLYKYRLDGEDEYPDPASRFQPEGPHGWSQVIDPSGFQWTDQSWPGIHIEGQIIYELHIGTWAPEGTWASAMAHLPELVDLGITLIELMPIAEFPGRFGWGYDGVLLFSPYHHYGHPDDFRRFVDKAHSLGMAVILDVVYNHLGPDGNYLSKFSPTYFSTDYKTDWGTGINFGGKGSEAVREFYLWNARYWIEEFHLDGYRLDSTQDIFDTSEDHILAAIAREARSSARGRDIVLIAENEPQHSKLVRPTGSGGYGLDALWNDDFHHSAMVALTGRTEAYYTDYRGKPQEFISAAKYGYLYQGQFYKWQKKRRGTASLDIKPASFISMLQNHDQVANSARGLRCHALSDPGRYRAMSALLLLSPSTPMLFQGQEFAASSPFFYFADHKPELAALVSEGRIDFMAQFRSLATGEWVGQAADPADPSTFTRSKVDHGERETHKQVWQLYRDLIRLRQNDPVFHSQAIGGVDGAVLAHEAFVLRFFGDDEGDRLLLINLGPDLNLNPAPEPLLAPPEGTEWALAWSSEDPDYGGIGTAALESENNWMIPGHAAFAMKSAEHAESTGTR